MDNYAKKTTIKTKMFDNINKLEMFVKKEKDIKVLFVEKTKNKYFLMYEKTFLEYSFKSLEDKEYYQTPTNRRFANIHNNHKNKLYDKEYGKNDYSYDGDDISNEAIALSGFALAYHLESQENSNDYSSNDSCYDSSDSY